MPAPGLLISGQGKFATKTAICSSIGDHGMPLIHRTWEARGKPERVNVLTHCNAGWLATVDWGTAPSTYLQGA